MQKKYEKGVTLELEKSSHQFHIQVSLTNSYGFGPMQSSGLAFLSSFCGQSMRQGERFDGS